MAEHQIFDAVVQATEKDKDFVEKTLKETPKKSEYVLTFGETILHLACLSRKIDKKTFRANDNENANKRFHLEIALIIAKLNPKLISTQIKQNFRRAGQTCLHILALKGDLELFEKLWELVPDKGTNGTSILNTLKAKGTEFDIDDKRKDHSTPGLSYLGETILSFAVCSGNGKLVEFLLRNDANPSIRDDYGNNSIHICCYHGKFGQIFNKKEKQNEFLVQHNLENSPYSVIRKFLKEKEDEGFADQKDYLEKYVTEKFADNEKKEIVNPFEALNKMYLTPFNLAISRGHCEIFDLLKIELWSYPNISCSVYPVHELDTFQPHSTGKNPYFRSGLQIAIENNDVNMVNHKYIDLILRVKWETYIKKIFLMEFLFFTLIVLSLMTVVATLPHEFEERLNYRKNSYVRLCAELITFVGAILLLGWEMWKLRNLGLQFFSRFVIQSIELESIVLGFAAIIGCFLLLNYAKSNQNIGPLVLIFYKMVSKDLVMFIFVMACLFFGFAQAFYLQMQIASVKSGGAVLGWDTLYGSVMWLFRYILADYEYLDFAYARTKVFATGLFICYAILTTVLMLNLLIAMLNMSFGNIFKDQQRQWRLQWANMILSYDLRIGSKAYPLNMKNPFNWFYKEKLGFKFPSYIKGGRGKTSVFDSDRYVFAVYDRRRINRTLNEAAREEVKINHIMFTSPAPGVRPNHLRILPKSMWHFKEKVLYDLDDKVIKSFKSAEFLEKSPSAYYSEPNVKQSAIDMDITEQK
ncbi:hypothetical protein HK099_004765 [Clydaea vesicula]|uniref:Ion transport domain-containing protein n=1 Tax=Clydaea vesicula TaxID=447962 RepID=A0AAD5U072_9FUNG|nr:hypothetical protein HK099_004765 [Clydaea vesicula]